MNIYVLSLGIFIGIVIVAVRYYHKIKNKNINEEKNKISNDNELKKSILLYIENDRRIEQILFESVSVDMFVENARKHILEKLREDYKNNIEFIPDSALDNPIKVLKKMNTKFSSIEDYMDIIEIFMNSEDGYNELHDIYIKEIVSNIQNMDEVEKEAIEYHKQFGIEQPGDPKLHPKEKESGEDQTVQDITDMDLNDLLNTGTVEDFTETLKEF